MKSCIQKKKILLFYPEMGMQAIEPQSPLALLSIAPGLEAEGFEPIIIDTRVDPNYHETIKSHIKETLFFGITSMTGQQIENALSLTDFLNKVAPDIPIVWGGIHATILPDQTIQYPGIDIVVKGEGELTIVDLAHCFAFGKDFRNINGICYKNKSGKIIHTTDRPLMDMNEVKMPAWHLIDMNKYGEIGVQTGRGCPFGCRFCYNHKVNDRRWRPKDIDLVIKELKFLKKHYDVNHITFYDDNFFSNLKRARALCTEMIKENLDIKWSTTCRADILARMDRDLASLIKKAGAHILYVGSESGSDRILEKVINKHITVKDILKMAENTRKYQLRVHTSFMAGFPGETSEERRATFNLMDKVKKINPDIYITTICVYTPYPGTPMYDDTVAAGFTEPESIKEWSDITFFNCTLPWLTPKEKGELETLAFVARFVFWNREIKDRYLKKYQYPAYWFYRINALIRWKLRFFSFAPEWKMFRRIVGWMES